MMNRTRLLLLANYLVLGVLPYSRGDSPEEYGVPGTLPATEWGLMLALR